MRKGQADVNLSIPRWTALNTLRNERTMKIGIKNNRLSARWQKRLSESKCLWGNVLWCLRPGASPAVCVTDRLEC